MKKLVKKLLVTAIGFSLIAGIVFQDHFISFAAEIEGEAGVQESGTDTNGEGNELFDQSDIEEYPDSGEVQQNDENGLENPDNNIEENNPESQSGEQKDQKENSWRYQNGNLRATNMFRSRAVTYPKAWQKVDGVYMNNEGEAIEGAVKKGIDVSEHQGRIDWSKVKADGIDFAIIRCGYGDNYSNQDDKQWQYNVSECERLGIPYGVYIYSYATNTTMAKSEAEHVLRLIKGRNLSYPVYFDMEDNSTINVSNEIKGQIAKTFCDTIMNSGYKVGIYANLNWWTNYLTSSVFNTNSWSKWIAQYNSTCDYNGAYDIWQSTDEGKVNGISGNVDLNFLMNGTTGDNNNNGGGNSAKEEIVSFASYMETFGWQETVHNGEDAGLPGYSKNLMGFKINIGKGYNDLGVKYSAHVSGIGWMNYVSNGALAGSTNNKGVEAVKIELTGNEASKYDIYYRVHIKNEGWMGWATNGQAAGTQGCSKRIESIQIKIVSKGSAAPGSTENAFHQPLIQYRTHIQTYGWQGYVKDGTISGTTGQSKRLEGINISLLQQQYSGNIEYKTHVQLIGWQNWKKNGELSGTTGMSRRLEAIQIRLTGEMEKHYDVYYRTHVQSYGWLDWAKNGGSAGTSGMSKRMEALQIQLVPKGGSAPGSTARPFVGK